MITASYGSRIERSGAVSTALHGPRSPRALRRLPHWRPRPDDAPPTRLSVRRQQPRPRSSSIANGWQRHPRHHRRLQGPQTTTPAAGTACRRRGGRRLRRFRTGHEPSWTRGANGSGPQRGRKRLGSTHLLAGRRLRRCAVLQHRGGLAQPALRLADPAGFTRRHRRRHTPCSTDRPSCRTHQPVHQPLPDRSALDLVPMIEGHRPAPDADCGGWRLARFVIAIHTTHAQVGPLRKLDKRFRLPSPAATDL